MRFALLIAVLLLAPPAMSCGCDAPGSIADVDEGSIIFKGRVIAVEPASSAWSVGDSQWDMKSYDVTFEVLDPIRDINSPTVKVSFMEEGSTSCDLLPVPIEVGSDWLLSADGDEGATYSNKFCDLRQNLRAPVGEGV